MAFLNPVALLYHRHLPAYFFRSLTPGHEAVVQAVGRVLASTRSDPPPERSRPVRYVQKPLSDKGPDVQGSALETGDIHKPGCSQPGLSDGESNGESKTYPKRRNLKTSRGKGWKGSNHLSLPRAFLVTDRSKSRTGSDLNYEGKVEKEDRQDITQPEQDAGKYLFGDPRTFQTLVDNVQESKSKRRIKADDPSTSARDYVMGLLARGLQTELNLRSKLIRRNVPSEVIDEIINDIQRCGLQSDAEYAEAFARSRWTDNTWGPRRIKYELLRRGISKENVDSALEKLFQTNDPIDGDQEEEEDLGKWGMTAEAAQHLINQAQRRWGQGDLKVDIRKRRMIGWLQRRGFSWTIIPDILKILETEPAP